MENRAQALAAGAFTAALLLVLGLAGAWLGRSGDDFDRVFVCESTRSVSGLNPRAVVRYRGVEVGRVEHVGFDPQQPQIIRIRIAVSPEAHVTTKTYARLASLGITGIAYVQLDDDGQEGAVLAGDPLEPPRLEVKPSTLEEFGDAGQLLLVRVNEIAQRMSYLLNEENQVRLGNSLASIERLTARFSTFQDRLVPVLDRMPGLVDRTDGAAARADEALQELQAAVHEAREQVRGLEAVRTGAGKMGSAADTLHDRTLPDLARLLDRMGRATDALERAAAVHADEPHSLLFGPTPPEPGPGEPGWRGRRR